MLHINFLILGVTFSQVRHIFEEQNGCTADLEQHINMSSIDECHISNMTVTYNVSEEDINSYPIVLHSSGEFFRTDKAFTPLEARCTHSLRHVVEINTSRRRMNDQTSKDFLVAHINVGNTVEIKEEYPPQPPLPPFLPYPPNFPPQPPISPLQLKDASHKAKYQYQLNKHVCAVGISEYELYSVQTYSIFCNSTNASQYTMYRSRSSILNEENEEYVFPSMCTSSFIYEGKAFDNNFTNTQRWRENCNTDTPFTLWCPNNNGFSQIAEMLEDGSDSPIPPSLSNSFAEILFLTCIVEENDYLPYVTYKNITEYLYIQQFTTNIPDNLPPSTPPAPPFSPFTDNYYSYDDESSGSLR